jgi:hypothetical protein
MAADDRFPDTVTAEHLCDVHVTLAPPENIGQGPYGHRSLHVVTGGTFDGPRLTGAVRPHGGDWLLTFPDGGYSELDVRATLETHDGALLYLSYHGVLRVDPGVAARVMAGQGSDGDYYFRTTPRFETGHPAYAWLNSLVTVAYGRFGPQQVAYRIFAIA